MLKLSKKFLSLVLMLALIASVIPLHSVAVDTLPTDAIHETADGNGNANEYKPEEIVGAESLVRETLIKSEDGYTQEIITNESCGGITEIIGLREQSVKHFALTDGTYKAVSYNQAVHRKDANGVWQDIDNSLSSTSVKGVSLYATSDGRTAFSQLSPAFALNENGYTVSMTLQQNVVSTTQIAPEIEISNAQKRSTTNSFATIEEARAVNNKSSIVYQNVKAGTDIEYILVGNDVKENIIVKEPTSSYVYNFELVLSGLTASLDANGNIILADSITSQAIYQIPAPYMYDANGAYSVAVFYTLTAAQANTYKLTVTASSAWINSADRVFPVTIDPTVSPMYDVEDTYIISTAPTANYGNSPFMLITTATIAYIKPVLPTLPDGAIMNWCDFCIFYCYSGMEGTVNLSGYRILNDWDENTLTWQSAAQNENMGLSANASDTLSLSITSSLTQTSPGGYDAFDVTELASLWYSGTPYYGVALKYTSGNCQLSKILAYEDGTYFSFFEVNYTHEIPDGVYSFRNTGVSCFLLGVDGANSATYDVKGISSNQSINDDWNLGTAFKISKVGKDRFVIRSMLDNNKTLSISNGTVVLKEIPSEDIAVPVADTFNIQWNVRGFLITSNSSITHLAFDASTNDIVARTGFFDYGHEEWLLERYTGSHRHGIKLEGFTQGSNYAGTTSTVRPVVWSTQINYNTPTMSYNAGVYDGTMSFAWNSNARTALIGWHKGAGQFTCSIKNLYGNVCYTETFKIDVSLYLNDGIYYIRNRELNNYLQVDDGDAPGYTTNGKGMELHSFAGTVQHWQLVHYQDSYYQIKCVPSGLALAVPSGSEDANNVQLIQTTFAEGTIPNNQLWQILPSENGTFIVRPKSGIYKTTDWCMSAGTGLASLPNGRNVEQRAYTNDTDYKDTWFFIAPSNNIRLEAQQQTNWCWAACARMMSMAYMDSPISQASAVFYIKLDEKTLSPDSTQFHNVNMTATRRETANAVNYILGMDNCYYKDGYIYSEAVLQSLLDEGYPVIACMGTYNADGNRLYGHEVLIYGYREEVFSAGTDEASTLIFYEFYDPAPVDQGAPGLLTYDKIVRRTQDDTHQTIAWDGIITLPMGNYLDHIPFTQP